MKRCPRFLCSLNLIYPHDQQVSDDLTQVAEAAGPDLSLEHVEVRQMACRAVASGGRGVLPPIVFMTSKKISES